MAEYPAVIAGGDITANLDGEHYNISSPLGLKDSIKALPGARWDSRARVWQVKRRWHGKVAALVAAHAAELAEERDRIERDAAAVAIDLTAFAWIKASAKVPGAWIVRTPWIDGLAARLRAMGGEWIADTKVWRIPAERTADLQLAAAALDAIIAPAVDRDRAAKAAAAARKTAEAEARAAARAEGDRTAQERRWYRVVCHAGYNPGVGAVLHWRGQWRVVEGHGKWFRAGEDLSSAGHPDLYGESVRYGYTRAATEAEIAEAEAAEARRQAEAERRRVRSEAIATVAAGEAAPATGTEPEGEVIWRDDSHAVTGYRRWIVLGTDGWLYHLTYDGSDGAAWGDYNAGYNTRASRLPADPVLVEAIREAGE